MWSDYSENMCVYVCMRVCVPVCLRIWTPRQRALEVSADGEDTDDKVRDECMDVAAAGCYLWQHQAQAITRGEPLIFIFATRQRTLWLWSPVSMPLWPSAMCSGAGA